MERAKEKEKEWKDESTQQSMTPCLGSSKRKRDEDEENTWFKKGQREREWRTHRQHETVFEVRKLFVALLAAEHAVLLVHHLLVAVFARTGLVQAVLLPHVHDGADASEVISLDLERWREREHILKEREYNISHIQNLRMERMNEKQDFLCTGGEGYTRVMAY